MVLVKRTISIFIILMLVFMGVSVLVSSAAKPGGNTNQGNGNGIQRHVDIARDADGHLHMVWQEPVGDQYEIFYGSKIYGKEMGIGADKNYVTRVSYTPRDSTWPQIAIDPATGLIYILWTESVPTTQLDGYGGEGELGPVFTSALYMVAADLDGGNQESLHSAFYKSPWTSPQNFAESSGGNVAEFSVVESEFTLRNAGEEIKKGIIDTDDDGIKDSDEILGKLGYYTSWRNPDSDGDKIIDRVEYEIGFDPLVNEYYTAKIKEYLSWLTLLSDDDSDSLTYAEEGGYFPVTMGVANILHTGEVTYRFYPKDDHDAYLTFGIQLKKQGTVYKPPAENVYFSLIVTVDTETLADQEVTYSDYHMEWERFEVEVGPFEVFENEITDVKVEIDLTPPGEYKKQLPGDITNPQPSYIRTLEIWSVMLADPDDELQFNYKEGRDFDPDTADLAGWQVLDFDIHGDNKRPDLFIEVDWFSGHEPTPELWSEATNAFSDAGIRFHYKIDQENLALDMAMTLDDDDDGVETLRNDDEQQEILHLTRNALYDDYIHFVFAHYIEDDDHPTWTIYGGARSAPTADDLTHCGVVFADEAIQDITNAFSTLMERRLKVVIHEIGHCLGACHETDEANGGSYDPRVDGADDEDDFNEYNVMRTDAMHDDRADQLIHGEDNAENRALGATELIGLPRFAIESVDQFDLTEKLSVDTGRNIDILDQYV